MDALNAALASFGHFGDPEEAAAGDDAQAEEEDEDDDGSCSDSRGGSSFSSYCQSGEEGGCGGGTGRATPPILSRFSFNPLLAGAGNGASLGAAGGPAQAAPPSAPAPPRPPSATRTAMGSGGNAGGSMSARGGRPVSCGPSRPTSGSRPGTASTCWSNYDLDPDAAARVVGGSRPVSGVSAGSASSRATASRSTPRGRPRLPGRGGSAGPAPNAPLCSAPKPSLGRVMAALASPPRSPKRKPASAGGSGTGFSVGSGASSSRVGSARPLHAAVTALVTPALLAPLPKAIAEVPTDAKGRPYPYVQPPPIPGSYPTISFQGSPADKQAAGLQPLTTPTLLVKYGGVANGPVRAAFKEAGLRPTKKAKRWLVQWGGILSQEDFAKLHEFQRVNHFPGTWELGHKGHLYRNVYNALRRTRGAESAFDIVPRFYILPRDFDEFRADLERYPGRMYIQKPTNSSRGRGIRMVTKPEAIPRDAKDLLIQHYISNPLLARGFKFDMRVYAIATCMDPLRLYVFHEGLARLATEPYSADKADLNKRCVHLTNYSVNKKSEKFVANTAAGDAHAEASGSKWSLMGLRDYLQSTLPNFSWDALWRQVQDIVAASVIAAEPRMNTEFKMKVPHRNNCFEVWGFDVMLDDALRAWLIEVNTCPSLAADSPMDWRVKGSMVAGALHLLGVVPYNVEVYERESERQRQARLTGLRADAGTGAGAGAAAAPGQAALGSGAIKARTIQEVEQMDFRGVPVQDLPDIVIEAEAEMARRGGWTRVFPCEEDPTRYLELFETPRVNNVVLCKFYSQRRTAQQQQAKAAAAKAAAGPPGP